MTNQQQINAEQFILLFNRAQRVLDEVCHEQKQTAFCRKKFYRKKYTPNNINMRERIIRGVAGTLVLTSILLAYFIDIAWLLVAAFVAVNLLQSSVTRFCPLETILEKAGVEKGESC